MDRHEGLMGSRASRSRETMAAVALLVLALLVVPVGANAAGTLMTIIDPNATTASGGARVDAGKLRIGDGAGNVSVDDGNGSLTVDGTVSARPALPGTSWRYRLPLEGSVNAPLFVPPSTSGRTTLAITSMTLENTEATPIPFWLPLGTSRTVCSGRGVMFSATVGGGETMHVAFPQPLVVGPFSDNNWCVGAFAHSPESGIAMVLTAVGYYF